MKQSDRASAGTINNNTVVILRLLFAMMVIYHHCYALGGYGKSPLLGFSRGHEAVGILAVAGFFSLSGFLVTRSYLRSGSFPLFMSHRILRIFPGFWVSLILVILIFAPFAYWVERRTFEGYFTAGSDFPAGFLANNFFLKMNQYSIAGLLKNNPYPFIWNGSLWTLAVEFLCYIVIGAAGFFGFLKKRSSVLAAAILIWATFILSGFLKNGWNFYSIEERLPWVVLYLFSGVIYALYEDKISYTRRGLIIGSIGALLIMKTPFYSLLMPCILPYLIVGTAVCLRFNSRGQWADYSYGIYLYAFPLQQIAVCLNWHKSGIFLYFLVSLLLTVPFALFHYRWVEIPYRRWR